MSFIYESSDGTHLTSSREPDGLSAAHEVTDSLKPDELFQRQINYNFLRDAKNVGYWDCDLHLRWGADLNAQDGYGRTALSYAAEIGHIEVVQKLLEHGANVHTKDESGKTAIIWASRKSIKNAQPNPSSWALHPQRTPIHPQEVIQELHNKGADLNAQGECGRTALSYAAETGHIEVVQILLDKGADFNAQDKCGRTALSYAAATGHIDVVQILLDKGADFNAQDKCGRTALSYAAATGHIEVVQILLDKGADFNAQDKYGRNALSYAAETGHIEVVQILLDKGADFNAQDKCGRTALSYAAATGHIEVVQILLDKGADFNAQDKYGRNALSYAAEIGHIEVVQKLLEHGANVHTKDESGKTAIIWASRKSIKNAQPNPSFWALHPQRTPIHPQEVIQELHNKGADLNAQDEYGKTALSYAAETGHIEVVQILLDKGADFNAQDKCGRTALSHAAQATEVVIIELLRHHEAKVETVDYNGRTAFSWLAGSGQLRQHSIPLGLSPVPQVIDKKTLEILRFLGGEKGAVADIADNNGRTPLSYAAAEGHTEMVRYICDVLGKENSRVFCRDKQGRSALSFAVAAPEFYREVIEILLKSLPLEDCDEQYRTPLHWFHRTDLHNQGDYISNRNKEEICTLLRLERPLLRRERSIGFQQEPLILPKLNSKEVGHLNRSVKNGKTLLSYAVLNEDINLVEVLCHSIQGIRSDSENDDDQKTALMNALERKNKDMILLLTPVADMKKELRKIVELENPDLMETLLSHNDDAKITAVEAVFKHPNASPDKMAELLESILKASSIGNKDLGQKLASGKKPLEAVLGKGPNGLRIVEMLLSHGADPGIWTKFSDWSAFYDRPEKCLIKLSRKNSNLKPHIKVSYGIEYLTLEDLKDAVPNDEETIFLAHSQGNYGEKSFSLPSRTQYTTYEIKLSFQTDSRKICGEHTTEKTSWGIKWSVKDKDQPPVIYESRLGKVWIPEDLKDFLKQFLSEFDDEWQSYCHYIEIHLNDQRKNSSKNQNNLSHINSLANDISCLSELRSVLQRQVRRIQEEFDKASGDSDGTIKFMQDILINHNRFYNEQLDRYEQVVNSLLQLEYTRHSIREAETITRISQVTFIYLPLMFASSLFGMNVDILRDNPGWYWYILVAAVSLGVTYILYQKNDWKIGFRRKGRKETLPKARPSRQ